MFNPNLPDPFHPNTPLTFQQCIALALPLAGLLILLTVTLAS